MRRRRVSSLAAAYPRLSLLRRRSVVRGLLSSASTFRSNSRSSFVNTVNMPPASKGFRASRLQTPLPPFRLAQAFSFVRRRGSSRPSSRVSFAALTLTFRDKKTKCNCLRLLFAINSRPTKDFHGNSPFIARRRWSGNALPLSGQNPKVRLSAIRGIIQTNFYGLPSKQRGTAPSSIPQET